MLYSGLEWRGGTEKEEMRVCNKGGMQEEEDLGAREKKGRDLWCWMVSDVNGEALEKLWRGQKKDLFL